MTVEHLTLAERTARGREARVRVPTSSHARWAPEADRPDPVALIEEQNVRRDADLVPVRHGRMMASPFTFYRGAAKIMATDLATTPTAGLDVQLCGDAHLSNFGVFGSPERRLVFDINDFDETLPGPFEYDVKRLAASLTVAAQNNGFSASDVRAVTAAAARSYRTAMAQFAGMSNLDLWYAHIDEDQIMRSADAMLTRSDPRHLDKGAGAGKDDRKGGEKSKGKSKGNGKGKGRDQAAVAATDEDGATRMTAKEARKAAKRLAKNAEKAHSRDSLQAFSKLTERVDGSYRIASMAPVIVPARELDAVYGLQSDQQAELIAEQFRAYRSTLQADRRVLLERFQMIDWARKVVGVGSVGTRAFIVLLQGRDESDPLFLQIKEATSSVLEAPGRRSRFRQAGARVVQGQRLMQASSDIFLGWTKGVEEGRHFYWRQLRDMKGSALVEQMPPEVMSFYGRLCGWTLARAHARSGDPVAISAYLGEDDSFDAAITDFSARYAAQNARDFADFTEAIRSARIEAHQGV
jgi:uncharacterized protein (DUF2252 family)